jgi:hypothetical protein
LGPGQALKYFVSQTWDWTGTQICQVPVLGRDQDQRVSYWSRYGTGTTIIADQETGLGLGLMITGRDQPQSWDWDLDGSLP